MLCFDFAHVYLWDVYINVILTTRATGPPRLGMAAMDRSSAQECCRQAKATQEKCGNSQEGKEKAKKNIDLLRLELSRLFVSIRTRSNDSPQGYVMYAALVLVTVCLATSDVITLFFRQ